MSLRLNMLGIIYIFDVIVHKFAYKLKDCLEKSLK